RCAEEPAGAEVEVVAEVDAPRAEVRPGRPLEAGEADDQPERPDRELDEQAERAEEAEQRVRRPWGEERGGLAPRPPEQSEELARDPRISLDPPRQHERDEELGQH